MSNVLFNAIVAKFQNKVLISPYAKTYSFTISEYVELSDYDKGYNFQLNISNVTDDVSYFITNANNDEILVSGICSSEINEELLLEQGDYKIFVQPNKTTEKPVRFSILTNVDNHEMQINNEVELFKFTVDEYMKCDITLNYISVSSSSTIKIYKESKVVQSFSFNENGSSSFTSLESGNYIIKIKPDDSTSISSCDIQCKTYKVGEYGEDDSGFDNDRKNSIVKTFSEFQNGVTDWLGPNDEGYKYADNRDFYKITGVHSGTRKLIVSVTNYTVAVVVYINDSTSSTTSFNVRTSNSPYTKEINLSEDCDLYVRVTASTKNTSYSMRIE